MFALAGFHQRSLPFAATREAADEFPRNRLHDQATFLTKNAETCALTDPEFFPYVLRDDECSSRAHKCRAWKAGEILSEYGRKLRGLPLARTRRLWRGHRWRLLCVNHVIPID